MDQPAPVRLFDCLTACRLFLNPQKMYICEAGRIPDPWRTGIRNPDAANEPNPKEPPMPRHLFSYVIVGWALLLLSPCPLHGQAFRGGMQAGLTASEVSGDRSGGPHKLGWFASVFTDYQVSEHAYWHLEILYIQKGSREFNDPETPEEGVFRDYKFYLQYIEVPVLFKFDFSVFERLPYVDWLTGEIGLSGSTVVGHYETNDFGDENTGLMARERPFNRAELNLLLGFYFPLREGLGVHFRYSQGVTPLRSHESGARTWYNRGQYNSVWSLGLSMLLF